MSIFFGILGTLIPLIVLGGIVAAVVVAVRRNGEDPVEPGIGTVRRIFFYGLAFVALMLATSGVTLLLSQVLDSVFGDAIIRQDSFRIAFGLAATIVGFPIWLLLWRAAERSLEQYPAERGTLGRKFYMYLVLGVSAAVVAASLVQLLQGILTPTRFDVNFIAPIVVWSALWGVHWAWERAEGQPTSIARSVRRLYVYVTSVYGLVLLTVGVAQVLASLLSTAYDALFGGAIIGTGGPALWDTALRNAIALAVVGGVWWWFHWHRVSAGDTDSVLRQIVIYPFAIFGGLVTAVSSAAIILLTFLLWLLDRPGIGSTAAHFQSIPPAMAAIVVGVGVWRYHSEVVLHEAAAAGERLVSARRGYRYLTAAVGLGTLAVGLIFLFGLVIGLLVPGARGDLTGTRWWAQPLAVLLTLIAVGGPLWWRYWFMQQGAAVTGVGGEREALSRRAFIFVVFGIAVLATLGSLSAFLVMVLQPLFEGRLTVDVLDAGKWMLGIVLTAGTISVYYWQVLREDRAALAAEEPAAAPAPRRPDVTALAPATAMATINAIATRLGVRVRLWQREDGEAAPDLDEAQIEAIAEQVRSLGTDHVLLLMDAAGARAVPFTAR